MVGWHPFDDFVVQFLVPTPTAGATSQVETRLAATEAGTHLAEIISKANGPLLARLAADAGMKALEARIRGLVATFKAHIEGDLAGRRSTLPAQAALSPVEVESAARGTCRPVSASADLSCNTQ